MIKDKIDELREQLYLLISENADYNKVLTASRELDDFISKFTSMELREDTISKNSEF